jgi:RNA polymerase sigma-70 factor (ECF subfamily)
MPHRPPPLADAEGSSLPEANEALVARIREGDERALEVVFHRYAGPMCTFALHVVRRPDLATEVVHDVFLRIWERRERLQVRDSLQAYLYRATRNRALDVMKRAALEQRWVERSTQEHEAAGPPAMAPAHAELERADLVTALERAVEEIPERRRMAFLLRWKDGLSYVEIAGLMGTSIKTVENQISRALRDLRDLLAPHID